MVALVRSAALTHFTELARDCGLDSRRLVVESGLPARCLSDPDLKVPADRVGRLLEQAAALGREPAFGLRLAESRRLSNLGPLALLVRDQPSLRLALETLMHHIHVHNEAVAVSVEPAGAHLVVRTELMSEDGHALRQATELVVGATCRVLRVLLGSGWQPSLVCFGHPRPASLAVHRRVLAAPLAFDHAFNGIVCRAADLEAPNPGADPVMARYSQRLLAPDLARQARLTDRTRQLIVLLMPRGLCRIDVVAQHLGVDRRTVHRHLQAEGSSFSALLDAERRALARRYVEASPRALTDVAALLGFSSLSAFSRWHTLAFGASAQRRRADAAAARNRREVAWARTGSKRSAMA